MTGYFLNILVSTYVIFMLVLTSLFPFEIVRLPTQLECSETIVLTV